MCNCKDCKHSVFDEHWGEYKCKVYDHVIYILLDSTECERFEKSSDKKRLEEK